MSQKTATKDTKSRAEQLSSIYKITNFIHRYRLFTPFFKLPTSILNGIGKMITPYVMKSPKLKARIYEGVDALFGKNISKKKKHEIYEANRRYMVQFYLDALFHSPNFSFETFDHFVTIKNIEYLDEALANGKGAIIVSAHTAMYFQLVALVYHPKKYPVLTVVQPRNKLMFEAIAGRPELVGHFKVVPNYSYDHVRDLMVNQLNNNGIVSTLFDYSKVHNLRVPMWFGKNSSLITTPQSAIRLHKVTGAPILPVKIIPDGEVGKSILEFLDPSPLLKISEKYREGNSKIYHGEMSVALNGIFGDFLQKFCGVWEEFRKFTHRMKKIIEINNPITSLKFLMEMEKELIKILEESYEPGRDDEGMLNSIKEYFNKAKTMLLHPHQTLKSAKVHIDLSIMTGKDMIKKVLHEVSSQMDALNESKAAAILAELSQKVSSNA